MTPYQFKRAIAKEEAALEFYKAKGDQTGAHRCRSELRRLYGWQELNRREVDVSSDDEPYAVFVEAGE